MSSKGSQHPTASGIDCQQAVACLGHSFAPLRREAARYLATLPPNVLLNCTDGLSGALNDSDRSTAFSSAHAVLRAETAGYEIDEQTEQRLQSIVRYSSTSEVQTRDPWCALIRDKLVVQRVVRNVDALGDEIRTRHVTNIAGLLGEKMSPYKWPYDASVFAALSFLEAFGKGAKPAAPWLFKALCIQHPSYWKKICEVIDTAGFELDAVTEKLASLLENPSDCSLDGLHAAQYLNFFDQRDKTAGTEWSSRSLDEWDGGERATGFEPVLARMREIRTRHAA